MIEPMERRPHDSDCVGGIACACGANDQNLYVNGFNDALIQYETQMAEAAALLSDGAHHKVMRMAGTANPCPAEGGCALSAEEHHRLAYGILNENKELKRRVEALEHEKDVRST